MRPRVLALLVLPLLLAPPARSADPWTEARLLALERETLALRDDRDRGSTGGPGLGRLRWDLRALHVAPAERRPALDRLERRLLDLERDASRVHSRLRLERSLAGSGKPRQPPDAYRPPWPEDLRGRDGLIGVGKLVVRIQRSLRDAGRGLAGRGLADARLELARAAGLLDRLERAAGRSDPTTIALRAEAARLRARLPD